MWAYMSFFLSLLFASVVERNCRQCDLHEMFFSPTKPNKSFQKQKMHCSYTIEFCCCSMPCSGHCAKFHTFVTSNQCNCLGEEQEWMIFLLLPAYQHMMKYCTNIVGKIKCISINLSIWVCCQILFSLQIKQRD